MRRINVHFKLEIMRNVLLIANVYIFRLEANWQQITSIHFKNFQTVRFYVKWRNLQLHFYS